MSGEEKAIVLHKPRKPKCKHPPTNLQISVKSLKTRLGNHIWYIKRIEKDLRSLNKLHRKGSVLHKHARAIIPTNMK